jgi:hypothetical protein
MKRAIVAVILGVVLMTAGAQAQSSIGKYCWTGSYSDTFVLNVVQNGNEIYSVSGYRISSGACNGSTAQPVTGTIILTSSGKYLVGIQSVSNQVGTCINVSWEVPLNSTTLGGSGSWRNAIGTEGAFTLTYAACPGAVPAAPVPPVADDPSRVR